MIELPARPPHAGLVFVLSGPSGVGKDSVMNELRREPNNLHFCVTATTRRCRPGEEHGRNHYFLSVAEFQHMIETGQFLEWAVVHEHYYGTPLSEVRRAFARGQDLLVRVDVQGAATLRRRLPQAVLIFLAPPHLSALSPRLSRRGTETEAEMAMRLERARKEMEELPRFDYLVVNYDGRLAESVDLVRAIIRAERSRVHPRWTVLP